MKNLKWGDEIEFINIIISKDVVNIFTPTGEVYVFNINDEGFAESLRTNTKTLNDKPNKTHKWVWVKHTHGVSTKSYVDFETKSSGLVRFFSMAKTAVKKFFHLENKKNKIKEQDFVKPEKVKETLKEVKATPVQKSKTFDSISETVVGVVDGIAIPNMEKIRPYFDRAVKRNNHTAVANLLKRLTSVLGERRFSVLDVLTFLEHSDLPITQDGRIVAYKRLVRKNGSFADTYTGNVIQDVGYVVQVPDELVDLDRDRTCSAGLHVARRSYIRHYSGNAIFIILVNPEDVLVVPHGDPDKIRCRKYEVVHVLNPAGFDKIINNLPLSDDDSLTAMRNIISGNIPKPYKICTIRGAMGSNIDYEDINIEEDIKDPNIDKILDSKTNIKKEDAMPLEDRKPEKGVEPKPVTIKEIKKITKKKSKPEPKVKTKKQNPAKPKKTIKKAPTNNSHIEQEWRTSIIIQENIVDPEITKTLEKVKNTDMTLTAIALSANISRRTLGRWIEKYTTQP